MNIVHFMLYSYNYPNGAYSFDMQSSCVAMNILVSKRNNLVTNTMKATASGNDWN